VFLHQSESIERPIKDAYVKLDQRLGSLHSSRRDASVFAATSCMNGNTTYYTYTDSTLGYRLVKMCP